MITREFNLYLHAGHSIPIVINANQYDRGEQWLFKLFNSDGTQYTPSSGAIVGIKSDNLGIINSGTVDSQGRVVINETQQMTAAVGKAVFELLIDDQTHGTANFIVLVEPKPGDNADLSESDLSLIQQAIDGTSATAIAQGVGAWMDENLTPTTPVVDASLTVQGAAADAKKTGDEISDLKSQIATKSGLTEDVKQALMDVAQHIGRWTDANAQTYIENLRTALYPPVDLSSISAVYTQSGNVYSNDSLDDLRSDLVVTAHYSDSTSSIVTGYTLSGVLAEGVSTVTVTYSGKTTTFAVTVSFGVRWLDLISETGTYVSARTGKNSDEITISNLDDDYWHHISANVKSRYVTLNISEASKNLNTDHPLLGLDKFADVTGKEVHLAIKNVVCSSSASTYYWNLTEAPVNSVDTVNNFSERYYGTQNRTAVITPTDNEIGGIGLYVDRIMTLSFDIQLVAY